MAVREFRLPDPGEGLVEADIVTWRVAVGDQVQVNDIVVEVETSKSLVELPTPYAGTVVSLLVKEGDTVDVGVPIIQVDDGTPAAAPPAPAAVPPAAVAPAVPGAAVPGRDDAVPGLPPPADDEAAPGGRVPVLVGYGPRTGEAKRRPRKTGGADRPDEVHAELADTFATSAPVSRRADGRSPLEPQAGEPVGAPLPGPGAAAVEPVTRGAVLAKPPVRKLAKDLGVDLDTLHGSGPGGVISRADVEAAGAAEPAGAGAPVGGAKEPAIEVGRRSAGSAGSVVRRRRFRPAWTPESRSRGCARRRRPRWSSRPSPPRTCRSG